MSEGEWYMCRGGKGEECVGGRQYKRGINKTGARQGGEKGTFESRQKGNMSVEARSDMEV